MRKGVCKRGHPLEGKNLAVRKSGKRACRTCRNQRDAELRAKKRGRPAEPHWHRYLPSEPFALWIAARIEATGMSRTEFGDRHGINPVVVRQVLQGRQREIHIDTVDRAMIVAGEPQGLEGLYPLEGLRETKDSVKR